MHAPYAEAEVARDGRVDESGLDRAVTSVRASRPADVLVVLHGWNNDRDRARQLFSELDDSICTARAGAPVPRLAVVGVLWPSIAWSTVGVDPRSPAASVSPDVGSAEALLREVEEQVEDPELRARLGCLVQELDSPAGRREYLDTLRRLLPLEGTAGEDGMPPLLGAGSAEVAFGRAAQDDDGPSPAGPGGPAGHGGPTGPGGPAGASAGDVARDARRLLNLTTYYVMKARSGVIGGVGVARVLRELGEAVPAARLHLAGHSFGARAATAAVAAVRPRVHSLTLLQGAFSHYAFAHDWDGLGTDGHFRKVPSRLAGPLLVTHSRRDVAIRRMYALASRLAKDVGSGLGGENDRYGGLGSNGALRTPDAVRGHLLAVGDDYDFSAGRVFNLRADEVIRDHGDVTGPQVGYALNRALAT
jgi:hypothetical protein